MRKYFLSTSMCAYQRHCWPDRCPQPYSNNSPLRRHGQWDEEEENTATYGTAAAAAAAARAGGRSGARDRGGKRKGDAGRGTAAAAGCGAGKPGAAAATGEGELEDMLDDVPLAERRLYASDAVVYAQVPSTARRQNSTRTHARTHMHTRTRARTL